MKTKTATALFGLLLVIAATSYAEKEGVPFPEGYRNWLHAKSMLIQPGHALENPFQGIHHIYANDKAASGLKTGKYTDGSVILSYFHGRSRQTRMPPASPKSRATDGMPSRSRMP
jgi:Cytochrome P460